VREFCRAGRSALYVSDMAACAGRVKASGWAGSYSAEQRFVAPSLLVLDEAFGKGVPGDFDADLLDRIVNRRHQRRRSTVLIANADDELFAERVGGGIVDRIREGGMAMRLAWPSFRGRRME
jgi:DNA replication protein DnaC